MKNTDSKQQITQIIAEILKNSFADININQHFLDNIKYSFPKTIDLLNKIYKQQTTTLEEDNIKFSNNISVNHLIKSYLYKNPGSQKGDLYEKNNQETDALTKTVLTATGAIISFAAIYYFAPENAKKMLVKTQKAAAPFLAMAMLSGINSAIRNDDEVKSSDIIDFEKIRQHNIDSQIVNTITYTILSGYKDRKNHNSPDSSTTPREKYTQKFFEKNFHKQP